MKIFPDNFTVAAVAPAGPVSDETLFNGVEALQNLGAKVKLMPHIQSASSLHRFLSASDDEREQRFLRSLDSLLRFDEFVSSLGVKILIEDQGFMLNGARNCRRICDTSGGRIGILADIGNIFFVDETPEQLLNEVGDFVRHVHVKDYTITDSKIDGKRNCVTLGGRIMNDAEIGTGDVNVADSLSLLERIGYGGMYSLEFAKVKDGEVERVIRRITEGC